MRSAALRLLHILFLLSPSIFVCNYLLWKKYGATSLNDRGRGLFLFMSNSPKRTREKYYSDQLCHGCRHAAIDKEKCGNIIQQYVTESNYSLAAAGKIVSLVFPESCARCNPETCHSIDKKFPSFRQSSPRINAATTHYLSSIPDENRLNFSATENMTAYLSMRENVHPQKLHLFEFNPSLVLLPEHYRITINRSGLVPSYIASFRISHFHACFNERERIKMYGGSWAKFDSMDADDYLGLALLGNDLTILQESIVRLTNNKGRPIKGLRYSGAYFGKTSRPDYRLFNLHDQLYLTLGLYITPLFLETRNPEEGFIQLPYVFSKGDFTVTIRDYMSCAVYGKYNGVKLKGSKNLQYFIGRNGSIMVDLYPGKNPHDVRFIDLSLRCGKQIILPFSVANEELPLPSFGTIEEVKYPALEKGTTLFSADRGSACCVKITHPRTGEILLMGISHMKTTKLHLPDGVVKNTYLSRIFAFNENSPFDIVARSGKFCLGFSEEPESGHPLWNLSRLSTESKMIFSRELINCPRIHFVTGMTEKYDDESKIIIAYGVMDCLSRFVEVDKSEIVEMLWNPSKFLMSGV